MPYTETQCLNLLPESEAQTPNLPGLTPGYLLYPSNSTEPLVLVVIKTKKKE
ncbi:MAG: hypothetical protein JSC189_000681 [Candidatus Tokpelaia sp. JSC189]|nr:MAG: hypothetical protein JSC189_000681 [Candidatus Tokpelaia sp. JSC189]